MYDSCFSRADAGAQGVLLDPSQLRYKKSKRRYDSFMRALYIDKKLIKSIRDGYQRSRLFV
jgi:hypothetical protein